MNSHYLRKVWENTRVRKLWISHGWDGNEFAKLRAMRTMRANVVYVATCQKCFSFSLLRANVPTCQRRVNYSTSRANVPKACQVFNLACQRAKDVPIIQFGVPIFQICLRKNYFSEEFFYFWILCLTFANF